MLFLLLLNPETRHTEAHLVWLATTFIYIAKAVHVLEILHAPPPLLPPGYSSWLTQWQRADPLGYLIFLFSLPPLFLKRSFLFFLLFFKSKVSLASSRHRVALLLRRDVPLSEFLRHSQSSSYTSMADGDTRSDRAVHSILLTWRTWTRSLARSRTHAHTHVRVHAHTHIHIQRERERTISSRWPQL